MKRFILISLFITFLSIALHAEVLKFQTTSLATRASEGNDKWAEWSDWEPCDVLIIINTDRKRINVYSQEEQEFDVISFGELESLNDGSKVMNIDCIDKDGLRCGTRLKVDEDGSQQIYFDYSDFMYVYNIYHK